MHRLLRQQLGKRPGTGPWPPGECEKLIHLVDAAYAAHDEEREELQRGVETLSGLLARERERQGGTRKQGEARPERKPGEGSTLSEATRAAARARARSQLPLLELDAGLKVVRANRAAARLFGSGRREAAGKVVFALLEPVEPERLARAWLEVLSRGEPLVATLACTARDGRALALEWVCLPVLRRDGGLRRVRVVLRDETPRVELLEERREQEERAAAALAGAGDATFDWVLEGPLQLSPAFARVLGLSSAPSAGKPSDWFDRVHPEDLPVLRAAIDAHLEGRAPAVSQEHRLRHADGSWRWFAARGAAVRDAAGVATRFSGLLTDVGTQRQLIERMAHDARRDPLTGLANRTLFLDLVRHSFSRTKRHRDYRFAVLFIDIDRFKQVNDAYGHAAGDELLVQISRRLTSCLREGDRLARHAGDEFTFWLDDVNGSADALQVASRVHQAMAAPFEVAGVTLQSSASLGVAIASSQYERAEDVLGDADRAMYRAKAQGPGRTVIFEHAATDPRHAQREQSEAELRRALLEHELRVVYLPIVDVASGRIEAFEALARWQHPRLGLVAPGQFLSCAAETGLIGSIDQWVLRTAGSQLRSWKRELREAAGLTLSVNLSQQLLGRTELPGLLTKALKEAELGPGEVNLDINQSSLGDDPVLFGSLAALRARGVGLHVDDFGAGQSWLGHLQTAELDSVKLDKSFIAGGHAESKALRGLVAMARDLGKRVIAEGVETADQLRLARDAGCHSAQGYLFSRPVDAVLAGALLRGVPQA